MLAGWVLWCWRHATTLACIYVCSGIVTVFTPLFSYYDLLHQYRWEAQEANSYGDTTKGLISTGNNPPRIASLSIHRFLQPNQTPAVVLLLSLDRLQTLPSCLNSWLASDSVSAAAPACASSVIFFYLVCLGFYPRLKLYKVIHAPLSS